MYEKVIQKINLPEAYLSNLQKRVDDVKISVEKFNEMFNEYVSYFDSPSLREKMLVNIYDLRVRISNERLSASTYKSYFDLHYKHSKSVLHLEKKEYFEYMNERSIHVDNDVKEMEFISNYFKDYISYLKDMQSAIDGIVYNIK